MSQSKSPQNDPSPGEAASPIFRQPRGNFAPADRSQPPFRYRDWLILRSAVVTAAVATVGAVFLRPQFTRIYEKSSVDLPQMTQWLLNLPAALIVIVGVLWVMGLIAKEFMPWSRGSKTLINVASLVLTGVFIAWLAMVLFYPLRHAIESLTQAID